MEKLEAHIDTVQKAMIQKNNDRFRVALLQSMENHWSDLHKRKVANIGDIRGLNAFFNEFVAKFE